MPPIIATAAAVGAAVFAVACQDTRLYPVRAFDASFAESTGRDAPADLPRDQIAASDGPTELPVGYICKTALVGFGAAAGTGSPGGTTGGGNVQPVTVTTLADLTTYASTNDTPQVIEIDAVIPLVDQVRVKSNKTIRGTVRGELVGSGLNLTDASNVIVQRLKISKALGTDTISVTHAQNIWIDHCDLSSELISPKGTYDGLVDITHGSTNVTVSWNYFHDHYNVSLVGHSVSNGAEDTGALTVTYHHNWFARTPNNCPRVRFGLVHAFNNLYQDVEGAVASQMLAQVFVEGNVFQRVLHPIVTSYEDPVDGFADEVNNIFDPDHPPVIGPPRAPWRPAYVYETDLVTDVPAIVTTCAGVHF